MLFESDSARRRHIKTFKSRFWVVVRVWVRVIERVRAGVGLLRGKVSVSLGLGLRLWLRWG